MIYGYARVSTESQHLEAQVTQLEQAGVDTIFKEKYTGTTKYRPVFETLLERLEPNDTLVVTKLDRFARNTKDALDLMRYVFDRHVVINILNLGIIDGYYHGRLIWGCRSRKRS